MGMEPDRHQLQEVISDTVGCDIWTLNAQVLGERIGLTLAERSELKIRTIAAVDATANELETFTSKGGARGTVLLRANAVVETVRPHPEGLINAVSSWKSIFGKRRRHRRHIGRRSMTSLHRPIGRELSSV